MRKIVLTGLVLSLIGCGQPTTQVDSSKPNLSSQNQLAPLVNSEYKEAVPNNYIVVLDEASMLLNEYTSNEQLVDTLSLNIQDAQVKNVYKETINGFSATLNNKALNQLRHNPHVKYIEQDTQFQLIKPIEDRKYKQPYPPSWGLDRIDQRHLPLDNTYNSNTQAKNVSIYILDTGIYKEHTDFDHRVRWGINTTRDGVNTDCNGHGTHVAATAAGHRYGVAKKAKLVAVKVLNCFGGGSLSSVLDGLEWASIDAKYSDGPAVANMSFGGPRSKAFDEAMKNAIHKHGFIPVAAAGNGFPKDSCKSSPAGIPGVITVASSNINDKRSFFSSGGKCVNIFAPGEQINSAWIGNPYAGRTISGTSMASPHVAGAIALIQSQHPDWGLDNIRDALISNSTKDVIQNPGDIPHNRLLYTNP